MPFQFQLIRVKHVYTLKAGNDSYNIHLITKPKPINSDHFRDKRWSNVLYWHHSGVVKREEINVQHSGS